MAKFAFRDAARTQMVYAVEAKQEGKWAVISVADDGPGVPDENKEKLFA